MYFLILASLLLYFVVDWVAVVDSCKLDLNLNSEITNVVDRDSVREIYFLRWYFFFSIVTGHSEPCK